MSRVCLLGDTHLGVRGGDPHFLEFQKEWFTYFFKKLDELGIKTVIQAGDLFDVRSHMKLNVMDFVIKYLVPAVKSRGIKWHGITGNHDLFYRDNNSIHSQSLLSAIAPEHFDIVDDYVGWRVIGGKTVALLPWLNKNNQQDLLIGLECHYADILIGHLELSGFPMYKGVMADHGMDGELFAKIAKVYSGHYHTVSSHKNIQYLGTPYHLTWADVQDGNERGFWVLDTETMQDELIRNEDWMTLFSIIEYDPNTDYDEASLKPYEGNIVKVIVKEKPNEKHYKKFTGLLAKANFIDYKVIDTTQVQLEKVEVSEEVLKLDTLSALNSYIEGQQEEAIDKDAVKGLAQKYYLEALHG